MPSDDLFEKNVVDASKRSARGAGRCWRSLTRPTCRCAVDDVIVVPQLHELLDPLLMLVPLQLLAYHIALARGCDIDQPRNLAKSVTVE